MSASTYKGVQLHNAGVSTGVTIEEMIVPPVLTNTERVLRSEIRLHDLGIYDRAKAEWIKARLRMRYPESSEPLTDYELEYIRREIKEGTL